MIGWLKIKEQFIEWEFTRKAKYVEKTYLTDSFSAINPTRRDLRLNPACCGGKQATNCVNYSTENWHYENINPLMYYFYESNMLSYCTLDCVIRDKNTTDFWLLGKDPSLIDTRLEQSVCGAASCTEPLNEHANWLQSISENQLCQLQCYIHF
jgi:hypothetical protein